MVVSLVSLVAAALSLMAALVVASRVIPDEYDHIPLRARPSAGKPNEA